jgi:Asp-tRNA(Asn)/Glu-tRNA(Gln) amidotransferase B subunit
MDEDNVKADAEYSNSSHTSSKSEGTSESVKNVDPFTFVEVKCEMEVSIVIKLLVSMHFYQRLLLVSTYFTILCELQSL